MSGILFLLLCAQFAALTLLSAFGAHRLWMVLCYFRLRRAHPQPHACFAAPPPVTVQLPVYNEPAVVERLIAHAAALDYPRDKLEIQILDDSTDETRAAAQRAAACLREQGLCIEHITRSSREGFKAGALAGGLTEARGEFVAVFDADFIPPPSFLQDSIHFFTDPRVGMVQHRWGHLNAGFSPLTRAQAVLLDGHFQIEHTVRNRSGLFFNFNGTAGIWRKTAIERSGGWQGDTLTEDLDLSYRAQLDGWQFVYLVDSSVPAELPVDIDAFKSQQHRWTKGAVEVLCKLRRLIWRAPISRARKAEAFVHLGANFCYPLLLLAGMLILPGLHAQNAVEQLPGWLLAGVRAGFLGAFASIVIFYTAAVRESRHLSWSRTLSDILLGLTAGIGLSLSNTFAVLEALAGKKSSFQRTPKTGITAQREAASGGSRRAVWRSWLPLAESGLAGYFLATVLYAIALGRFETVPFAGLFLISFTSSAAAGLRRLLHGGSLPLPWALEK